VVRLYGVALGRVCFLVEWCSNMYLSANVILTSGSQQLNMVLLVGLAIFLGTAAAGLFEKFHIPRVIGYIVIGIILGPLLKLFSPEAVNVLEPFSLFALGIIGFLIGGELKKEVFVRFGRQVAAILLFEGITAFVLVTLMSFLVLCCFFEWHMALAVAVVFGAICAATDPASSVSVLWEYKARGPLTTMLTAIVALDDVLAIVLYIICVGVAGFLTGHKEAGLVATVFHSLYEVIGSLGLGAAAAMVMGRVLKQVDDDEKALIFTLGIVVLCTGLATSLKLDVILSAMAVGVTFVNLWPRQSIRSFELVRRLSPPVYVLFFVIVGARLDVRFEYHVSILAAVYVIGSIVGKTVGCWWGAAYSGATRTIKRYLGFCLYQQGTVAVALLLMASQRFEGQVRDMMLSVIIVGVFVLQLVGPLCVKFAIKKAGEAGMNITERDLIKAYRVENVMDTQVPVISTGTPLSQVIAVVSSTDKSYYPIVDSDMDLIGATTLDGIRKTFATQELNDWLVALDIAEPVIGRITPGLALAEALEKARRLDLEHLPVLSSETTDKYIGVLDCRAVRRQLSAEVLARQQKADSIR